MKTEFRIIATMTFDNPTDRDTWFTAIKTAVINAKATKPAYKRADMTKDDYGIPEAFATEQI